MAPDAPPPLPLRPRDGDRVRVVIAGGGYAAAEALVALRRLAGERVAIDLVAPNAELALRPLAVAVPFGMQELRGVPLTDLCADHGATLHEGSVSFVDVPGRRLETDRREALAFDAAVVATGARARTTIDGALLFDGRRGIAELRRVVDEPGGTIAFAVPAGVAWTLPAYELALLTAARVAGCGRVVLVSPETAPLEDFGPAASGRVAALLAEHGVELVPGVEPLRRVPAGLQTTGGLVAAHHVVALPRADGPRVPGLLCDADGFLPVDAHQLVDGTAHVYAAGDAVAFPLKQGGLAAQMADAAAEAIAARAGAPVEPRPFRPVLRAMLLTGALPLFLRGPGAAAPAAASGSPLWRPHGKVAAEHLSPWLEDRLHARLGTAARFADRTPPPEDGTEDREAALDLALTLADEEAAAGAPGRALEWLEAAEAIEGVLPPAYVEKRRRWRSGAPMPVRAVGVT